MKGLGGSTPTLRRRCSAWGLLRRDYTDLAKAHPKIDSIGSKSFEFLLETRPLNFARNMELHLGDE